LRIRGNTVFYSSTPSRSSMTLLKLKVRCFRCLKEVDKMETRPVESISKDPRYECFSCFKKDLPQRGIPNRMVHHELYCERCRYKFRSKSPICPYCNKSDQLESAKITVYDLL